MKKYFSKILILISIAIFNLQNSFAQKRSPAYVWPENTKGEYPYYTQAQADFLCSDINQTTLVITEEKIKKAGINPNTSERISRYLNETTTPEERARIKTIILDVANPDAEPLFAYDYKMNWAHVYPRNLKNLWLSQKVDVRKFLKEVTDVKAKSMFASTNTPMNSWDCTLYVPENQLPKGMRGIFENPDDMLSSYLLLRFRTKTYTGDVYSAAKLGDKATKLHCNNHVYNERLATIDKLYKKSTCKNINKYYYSCEFCGKCEYNPNHTFSYELSENKPEPIEDGRFYGHHFIDHKITKENFVGINSRGERVYWKSCSQCGNNVKDCNSSPKVFNRATFDFALGKGLDGTYEQYMEIITKQWNTVYKDEALENASLEFDGPSSFAVLDKVAKTKVSGKAENDVNWAFQNDLVDEKLFGNDYTAKITKLQCASLAVNLAEKMSGKEITPVSKLSFPDTENIYARKAAAAGIAKPSGAFNPNTVLSRQQMATYFYRALQYVKKNSRIKYTPYTPKLEKYSDNAQIAKWAREPMGFMDTLGLIEKTSEKTISPEAPCTIETAIATASKSFYADKIGWYQARTAVEADTGFYTSNRTARHFLDSALSGDDWGGWLRYVYTGGTRIWVTGPRVGSSRDYARHYPTKNPYNGETIYVIAEDFLPIKAD